MDQVALLKLVAVGGAALVMLVGIWLVFERLKAKRQGFGPNGIKTLGILLLVPSLVIIAIAIPNFHSETLAALFGTVAGYVLSQSRPDDR